MSEFQRVNQLPEYVFNILARKKQDYSQQGIHIIDFGMGNPDQTTAPHILDALREALEFSDATRYSASQGIQPLRQAICDWYEQRFGVSLDPNQESLVTIGSKEGLAHLALAITGPGDLVMVPTPAYPIHTFGFVIAGANVLSISLASEQQFLIDLEKNLQHATPKPKLLVLNFPSNPTSMGINLNFFEKVIGLAKKFGVWVLNDFAYADIVFDGYRAPSILQIPGAKEIAVETYSLSKSYNMPGWRVGFMNGNRQLISALIRLKSYIDYGMFAPIQHAAVAALTGSQACVEQNRWCYQQRRDHLCQQLLKHANWKIDRPRATMFVWAKIPEPFQALGSFGFCDLLLEKAHVAVTPGVCFGQEGDQYVRFSLVQEDDISTQACLAIGKALRENEGTYSQVA
ncbi:MAG: aminotransferase class I/II-fold pyridoxal phosphate-dependent enzyme [Legionellales bacterium]|nr:aminotransferase class I/II-fold pyridoxal phosphate-dependent enzyme [Legionellales bacterium]